MLSTFLKFFVLFFFSCFLILFLQPPFSSILPLPSSFPFLSFPFISFPFLSFPFRRAKGWEAKSLTTLAQCHQAAEELQQTLNIPTVIVCTAFGNVLHTRLGAMPFLSDTMTIPHMRVKVVDFIGAADAFTGGFVAALTRGLSMRYAMLWAG
jgi:sugar/nucleoside kinase (ribokinase family)